MRLGLGEIEQLQGMPCNRPQRHLASIIILKEVGEQPILEKPLSGLTQSDHTTATATWDPCKSGLYRGE